MFTIQHKAYGEGKVINKEMKGNDIMITAQFNNGKQCDFASGSFEMGVVKAEGALKAEIDAVIAARQAAEEARKNAMYSVVEKPVVSPVVKPTAPSKRRGRTPARKVTVKGPIQTQYEEYLKAAGYPITGKTGKDSTVPAYVKAVGQVLQEEDLTWAELEKNIEQIVTKYDVGGVCEDFGAKSNRTVINALKRFAEFVKSTKSSVKVGV